MSSRLGDDDPSYAAHTGGEGDERSRDEVQSQTLSPVARAVFGLGDGAIHVAIDRVLDVALTDNLVLGIVNGALSCLADAQLTSGTADHPTHGRLEAHLTAAVRPTLSDGIWRRDPGAIERFQQDAMQGKHGLFYQWAARLSQAQNLTVLAHLHPGDAVSGPAALTLILERAPAAPRGGTP
jgi:hypothetical protein